MGIKKVVSIVMAIAMIFESYSITYSADNSAISLTPDAAAVEPNLSTGAIVSSMILTDISGHWAYDVIKKMTEKGIVFGYAGLFRPDDPITRGEIAIILNRLMDYREIAKNTFSDLPEGQFYTEAVLKMNAASIMLGYEGKVRPKDNITREETAVLLSKAFNIPNSDSPIAFLDASSVSEWARGSVFGMEAKGFVNGYKGYFQPKSNITRAEAVIMIYNILYSVSDPRTVNTPSTSSRRGTDSFVPVGSISLTPAAMSLLSEGAGGTITSIISPANATNKNVTWISSNASVAAVNASGFVTPGIAGAATITAASVADGTKTAACTITVSPTGITGSVVLTDQNGGRLALGEVMSVSVTDADLDGNNALAETVSITVTSDMGGVQTINVMLTETAVDSGIFEGTFTLTAATNDGMDNLGCSAGSTITAIYDDMLNAAGSNHAAVTATDTVDEGITGSIALNDQDGGRLAMGEVMSVSITDSDLDKNALLAETVSIAVTSNLGGGTQTINITLMETAVSSGIFEGTFTLRAVTNDGTDNLGCAVGNTITATYDDTLNDVGADPPAITATDIVEEGLTGSISITDINGGLLLVGETMRASVTDNDLNINPGLADTVLITATSNLGGGTQIINVILTETAIDSGIFEGTFTLAAATNDGTDNLGCEAPNTITAAYDDTLNAAGTNPAAVTSKRKVKGITGSITYTDQNGGRIALGDVMRVSVTDEDLNDNDTLVETVSIVITSNLGGGTETINITLTETAAGSGIFQGTFTLMGTSNDGADQLGCAVENTITASYDDMLDATLLDPPAVTAAGIVKEGVNGIFSFTTANLHMGDTITAYINDMDLNTDSGLVETFMHRISNTSLGDSIEVTMTETAANSGRFQATFTLGAVMDDDNDILAASVGDMVGMQYIDWARASGYPSWTSFAYSVQP